MSGVVTGEDGREQADPGPEPGSEYGGKRDSDASSGSEGSQRPAQVREPAPGRKNASQPQSPDEGDRVVEEQPQGKRHVEASPQGRYLRFEDKLGVGQYKVVYRSYDTSMGIEVAWNTVNIKNLPKEEKKRIMNEVRLLQNLEHKNLVQFHGSWVNRDREEVIFVTEIMQSGSLMDFIRKVEVIRWRVVKRWARQILRGMDYLHSQDPPIIHRDLKCDNIFINGGAGDIRIGDLGLSTSNTRSQKTMSVLGTPEFMAPELYEESYNEKVDVYAFGMCMLEMITKERPYSECVNAAQIYRKVTSQILPSALDRVKSDNARKFIRECLNPDPKCRPTAKELLEHEFLKPNDDEDNSLVTLVDPPLVEGGGALDAGSSGGGVAAPAKIDPTLPGIAHPAHKGAPGLDTIAEATPGGLQGGQGQAISTVSFQPQTSTSIPSQSGGAGPISTVVVSQSNSPAATPVPPSGHSGVKGQVTVTLSSQGHVIGSTGSLTSGPSVRHGQIMGLSGPQCQPSVSTSASTPGHSGASNSTLSEAESTEDVKVERLYHKPSQGSSLPVAHVSDGAYQVRESSGGAESWRTEHGLERRSSDISAQSGAAVKTDGSDIGEDIHEAQYGGHKIPINPNPPFESDDDEDPQEHDVNHPEGFLRAMPEDERGMRVLKLPDGRVRRVEDDEEASAQASGDDGDSRSLPEATSSSAQAPPLSPVSAQSRAEVVQVAEVTGTATSTAHGLPPANDGATLLSRENSGSILSTLEAGSVVTLTGSSTPGTVSPSGMPVPNVGSAGSTFPQLGNSDATVELAKSSGTTAAFVGSDLGVISPPVGPPVALHRTQSFSPVDIGAETLGAVAPPPIAPAPPRPRARSDALEPQATGDGSGQLASLPCDRDKPPPPLAPADQETAGMLAGPTALDEMRTEIKVAHLQGSEQEIMRLVMHTQIDGRLQEVEFDFNLEYDSPEQVSAEMVRELGLPDDELGRLSDAIGSLADRARRRRIRHTSSNGSVTVSQASTNMVSLGLGGDTGIPGGSEAIEIDAGAAPVDEEESSDDDVDIEEDDEFRRRRLEQEKKKRQAENAYDTRLAALLAARKDRTDEHERAQERYKKDCEDFDKKVEKLQSEKDRRMEECMYELRGLEDGYRQKHRDARQAKRNMVVHVGHMMVVGQPPPEQAPKPQGHPQHQNITLGQKQGQNSSYDSSEGAGHGQIQGAGLMEGSRTLNMGIESGTLGDDVGAACEQQLTTLSQHKSGEDVLRGGSSIWSSNRNYPQDAIALSSAQGYKQLADDEEARRDRFSTL